MKRGGGTFLVAFGVAGALLCACSVITSFNGYVGGDAAAEAGRDGASDADGAIMGSMEASAPDGGDGGADAALDAPVILACTAPGLVAYWPMNEGSGAVLHDCVHGFDGMFGNDGGVAWGTRNGKGSIEISDQGFVTFGTQAALQLSSAMTISGFMRSDAIPMTYSSLFWDFANGKGYEVTLSYKGELYGQVGDGTNNQVVHFPMLTIGTWHHLAFVFTPGMKLEAFFDGQSFGSTPTTISTVAASTGEQRMGGLGGSTWTGAVSDVRVFSRALTQDEIAVLASQ